MHFYQPAEPANAQWLKRLDEVASRKPQNGIYVLVLKLRTLKNNIKTLVSELMLGEYSLLMRQGSCLPFADSVCPLVHHGRRYWYMRTKVKTPHYFLPSCRYRQRWV